MRFAFDRIFGVHPHALGLRARRSELLMANIANADTPHYKARDVDFRAALNQVSQGTNNGVAMRRTHAGHLTGRSSAPGGAALYRIPMQPSLDGNTVEADVELAAYTENALRYQASLRFLNGKIQGMKDAIKVG